MVFPFSVRGLLDTLAVSTNPTDGTNPRDGTNKSKKNSKKLMFSLSFDF